MSAELVQALRLRSRQLQDSARSLRGTIDLARKAEMHAWLADEYLVLANLIQGYDPSAARVTGDNPEPG